MIRLFVGLGNPGTAYEATRHNAGFWWVDALARQLKTALVADKGCKGLLARATAQGRTVWLLEPQTFMNLSGQSVAALARFYKIAPHEILVAHDELDIAPGQVKLKLGGGHAGHNGLRDIADQLGSADFWRLRIGIGHPGVKSEVVGWVLQKPAAEQREAILRAIERTMPAADALIAGDTGKATLLIHTDKPPRAKPVPRAEPPAVRPTVLPGLLTLAVASGLLAPPPAPAQTAYRCGNTYSDSPCPGALVVPLDDGRTPEQKAAREEATRRVLKSTAALEKQRLQAESAGAAPPGRTRGNGKPGAAAPAAQATASKASSGSKPKEAPYFVARPPPPAAPAKAKP